MIQYIVIIGAAAQLAGTFFYIKEMFAGRAKPNRITWFLWSVAPLIASAAAFSEGVRWAVLPVLMSGFGPLLILIASFFGKKSYWRLEPFDYFCGGCSILAIFLWRITGEPNLAIGLAIVGDAFAAAPTIIKSWRQPETESSIAYLTGLISAFSSFFAVTAINFSELAFPIYLIALDGLIIFSLYRQKFFNYQTEEVND